ncbi:Leucine-rich repeat and immunoglobulin-like domain-containing nogo receptor-interacting protein 2 [Larimichthys crocea]|nr:Leucine-rich repeat and immunoglobulin-like domain-containing nogo receptor-interacting protein 2 [Larimichthys crocea]
MRHPALLHCHLFLGGALLLLLVSPALSCPARCECSAQSKSVSCHRKRLPTIPEGIPIETRVLDLSKNKLRIITPDNFSSFQQLEDLDLSDNLISVVEPGSFRSQLALRSLNFRSNLLQLVPAGVLSGLTNLTRLDLSHNRLVVLLDHAFQDLRRLTSLENRLDSLERGVFASPDSLQRLCLGGNPLVCDCRLLWLLNSHKPPSLQVLDVQPECSAPEHLLGKTLRDLKEPLVSRYMTCTKPRIGPNTTQLLMADEGQPAHLSCMAEGAPRPSVVWITPHRRYITAKSSGRVEVQPDGTLEIKAAELHDSGVYLCIASNPAGNASLSASLAVKSLGIGDRSHYINRSSNYLTDSNSTWGNGTVLYNMTVPIDIKTIIISTAMGCLSFLGVVIFCFLLLFAWSRGKGRHKSNFDIEYVPRKSNGAAAEVTETSGPRRVNMKMI